jgi:mRNA-degrading endonuclease RelE of RelBE toxin-antitoxin system
MLKIEAKRRVLRALEKLDRERKDRVREVLIALRTDPVPFRRFDVAKLRVTRTFTALESGT